MTSVVWSITQASVAGRIVHSCLDTLRVIHGLKKNVAGPVASYSRAETSQIGIKSGN